MFWYIVIGITAIIGVSAIVIMVSKICYKEIIKAIRSYKIKKKLKKINAEIVKRLKEEDYHIVKIKITETNEEIHIKSQIDENDYYIGEKITI